MALPIPKEYGYVMAVAFATIPVNMFQVFQVISARKKYDVKYPDLYAPHGHKNAKEFNCVQRAHQQTLENLPIIYMSMLLSGLRFPTLAATFGGVWVTTRIPYTLGYRNGGPEGRKMGQHLGTIGGLFPLIALLGYSTFETIREAM
mmetsp:Transcript_23815/g.62341  ORF Transcript_23815/g.62341 Transcript_23815/m.62341 type:complete len:146 (+) Transcript_23815:109-546(+)